jgi:peptidoglycan hydrolase-like protein with peptidoglycan-binding domain
VELSQTLRLSFYSYGIVIAMSDTPHDESVAEDVAGDVVEPVVEPVVELAQAPVLKEKKASSKRQPSPAGQAVSGHDVDPVRLSSIVYKNRFQRKTLSVHHLQRRLSELGYHDAYSDTDGWYGDLTKAAVAAYQADNGLAGEGVADIATLESLFSDDPNVAIDN